MLCTQLERQAVILAQRKQVLAAYQERLAERGFDLPTYKTLGQADIDTIADRIRAHGRGTRG